MSAKTPIAEDRMLHRVLPTARRLARAAERRAGADPSELESVALGAALDAVRRFSPATGGQLVPFAAQRIQWALLTALRRRRRRLDVRRGLPLGVALRFCDGLARPRLGEPALAGSFTPVADLTEIAMCSKDDPEQALVRKRDALSVQRAVDALREPARSLLRRHYFEGEHIEQAARALGLSAHRAYRLHRRAVGMLRKRLIADGALDWSFVQY